MDGIDRRPRAPLTFLHRVYRSWSVRACALSLIFASGISAQCIVEEFQCELEGVAANRFGHSVFLRKKKVVVGGIGGASQDEGYGIAKVYEKVDGEWVEEQLLAPADRADGDEFGRAVAMFDDVILVGAPKHHVAGTQTGSAYVFRYVDGTGWVEDSQQLVPAGIQQYDNLGWSVALDDNVAAVGAYGSDLSGRNSGAVYVFRYDPVLKTWSEEATLTLGDDDDRFGNSLSLQGDTLIVGAHLDETAGNRAGSVHVYEFDGVQWNFSETLLPGLVDDNDFFGESLCFDGETLIVGAPGDDDVANDAGSAHVFEHDGDVVGVAGAADRLRRRRGR